MATPEVKIATGPPVTTDNRWVVIEDDTIVYDPGDYAEDGDSIWSCLRYVSDNYKEKQ